MLLLFVLILCIIRTWSQQDDRKYLINTPNCKIPRTDIINDEILTMMDISDLEKYKKPYCHFANDEYKPPLIGSISTTIFVIPNATEYYISPGSNDLSCSYTSFWKAEPDNKKNGVQFGETISFVDSVHIPSTVEFIRVICKSNYRKVYEDYLAFVRKKPGCVNAPKHNLSVLIFAIDSLSRGNFHRQMHRTRGKLEELDFVEYLGYNKVGQNTFPNIVPLFTGNSTSELKYICWPEDNSYFDECPFIWRKYKQNGYSTAYFEEQSWLGAFFNTWPGTKSGFIDSPTDYYYTPFDRIAFEAISHNLFGLTGFCFGAKPSVSVLLDYTIRLVTTLTDTPLFGFFFASTISHDSLNLPRIFDHDYEQLFATLQTTGLTQSSVIIFMGDHGLRFGDILETKEGQSELRLPIFKVSFPPWFRQKYPLAYANLVANANRLTTHYDTHEMLDDLLDLDNLLDDTIVKRTNEFNQLSEKPRGISLFLPIPETRSCHQAGIPLIYCACDRDLDIPVDDHLSERVANFMISTLNEKLATYSSCARLSLGEVKESRYVEKETETVEAKKEPHLIRITIMTTPGDGLFQALIETKTGIHSEDEMRVYGSIIRLNAYNDQRNELKAYMATFLLWILLIVGYCLIATRCRCEYCEIDFKIKKQRRRLHMILKTIVHSRWLEQMTLFLIMNNIKHKSL